MRLNEFEQLNLAVNFHEELNPRLWEGDRLQPEVRKSLLRIADHFKDFLGVDVFDLLDITISGSNAAYTYTPHSDIDLHLVVMIPEEHEAELKELFTAKKYQYNDQHDIKIRGYDVELYVQDAEDEHHSMGVFSVTHNRWVKHPVRQRAQIDDIEVQEKYRSIKHRINQAIVSDNHDSVSQLWQSIKRMRQTGLEQGGEFSPENLAFKVLRADGSLEKLRRHMGSLEDQGLSLTEADKHSMKPEMFLDMDGVLADFFTEYAKMAGIESGNYRDIPPAKTDPTLDMMIGTDFFARLPKFPSADALVSMVVKLFGHYNICSSPLRGDHANSEKQKKVWIERHLSPQPRGIIITPNKPKYATQPDGTPNFLIDDRGDNISKWEAAGGIGIKYQADEDSLDTIVQGLKRGFEIIRKEREHEPQELKSLDRGMPVAVHPDEPISEDIDQNGHMERIQHFINWVYKKERINAPKPNIKLSNEKDSEDMYHTGWYNADTNTMWVYTGNRNLIDILRTIAHELRHRKQGSEGRIHGHSPPGSKLERDADAEAGYLMKLYGKEHPEIIE
jgi:hypothetical protein